MVRYSRAIMGQIATTTLLPHGELVITSVDVGTLVRRLILFDKAIVTSVRFKDLPALVQAFGDSGLRLLIQQNLLQFHCESRTVATDIATNGKRHLPLSHYSHGIVQLQDTNGQIRKGFANLRTVSGLKNYQRALIEEAVWNSKTQYSDTFGARLLESIDNDLRTVSPALSAGILHQLHSALSKIDLTSYKLDIHVEETAPRIFRVETSLGRDFGMSEQLTHETIQCGINAVVNLNQRLGEMQEFSTLIGCSESEASVLYGKFVGLIASVDPHAVEREFTRVIELTELPDFKPNQKVDVQKLLKIRDSDECRAFRDWLSEASSLSDDDIREMSKGVRNRISDLGSSAPGKALRLAATTGIGLIPGAGIFLGPAASAVDTFLVDHALRRPAVIAFLTTMYPSLFSK
jgi:hypothetical protein